MRYAPFLPVLIVLVVLMAGPGMRRVRAGESILITVGGFLLLAILFSWILFRSS